MAGPGVRTAFVALLTLATALSTVAPAHSETTITQGDCAWGIKADPDRINIAFPDEGAQYWLTRFTALPGVELRISGRYPNARYFSFHVYEASTPVDALADFEITPSTGTNKFVGGADRRRNGTYDIRLLPGARPKRAERNTLYASSLNGEPNLGGVIIYRVYLPEGNKQGGVPLPEVSYAMDGDGGTVALPIPSCADTVPSAESSVLNDTLRGSSLPVPKVRDAPDDAQWGLARSEPQAMSAGPVSVRTGNVFFPNFHNQYLSLLVPRSDAEVVVFRAKAPTYVKTRGSKRMPSAQLRYWSICSNDFPTTRYVACSADEQIKVDGSGFFTMVVSDPDHRPSTLRKTDNWLPSGPYADVFILYRHMLPSPSFRHAIQRAPDAAGARKSMGQYYPRTRKCAAAQFEKDRCGLS